MEKQINIEYKQFVDIQIIQKMNRLTQKSQTKSHKNSINNSYNPYPSLNIKYSLKLSQFLKYFLLLLIYIIPKINCTIKTFNPLLNISILNTTTDLMILDNAILLKGISPYTNALAYMNILIKDAIINSSNVGFGQYIGSQNLNTNLQNYIYICYDKLTTPGYNHYVRLGQKSGIDKTQYSVPILIRSTHDQYIISIKNNNTVWISYWKNIDGIYSQLYCLNCINNNRSKIIDIKCSIFSQIYICYQNGQISLLIYNQYNDKYRQQNIYNFINNNNIIINISNDGEYLFYYQRISINCIEIYKYYINKISFPYTFIVNNIFYLNTTQNISNIIYNVNNNNFYIQLTNYSTRICGFNWGQCYYLNGQKLGSMNFLEQLLPQNKINIFRFINVTHYFVMDSLHRLIIYQTNQFQGIQYLQTIQWPQGYIQNQPLTTSIPIQISQNTPQYISQMPNFNNQQQLFQDLSTSSISLIYIISLPQAPTMLGFLNPLYYFLDNFWFYSYHRRQYTSVANRTFNIIRLLDDAKLLPLVFYKISDQIKSKINFNQRTNSSFAEMSPIKFIKYQKQSVYFLSNCSDLLILGTFYQIIFIIIIKIILKISFIKNSIIGKYIKNQTQIIMIIANLIHFNVQYYSFMAFTQIKIVSQQVFENKINLIVTFIILFVIIFYSIGGFMIFKILCSKESWQQISQINSRYNKKSMYFASFWITIQSLMFGFFHGFFQQNDLFLEYGILFLDSISIILVIVFRKAGKSNVSTLLLIFHLILRFIFDCTLFFQFQINNQQSLLQSILLAGLILMTIYGIFWEIFLIYREQIIKLQNKQAVKLKRTNKLKRRQFKYKQFENQEIYPYLKSLKQMLKSQSIVLQQFTSKQITTQQTMPKQMHNKSKNKIQINILKTFGHLRNKMLQNIINQQNKVKISKIRNNSNQKQSKQALNKNKNAIINQYFDNIRENQDLSIKETNKNTYQQYQEYQLSKNSSQTNLKKKKQIIIKNQSIKNKIPNQDDQIQYEYRKLKKNETNKNLCVSMVFPKNQNQKIIKNIIVKSKKNRKQKQIIKKENRSSLSKNILYMLDKFQRF